MKKPQTLSLQEQLLKTGLASDTKAKQIKADKRKQSKLQRNNGSENPDKLKIELEKTRLQQAERDRELNQLHKEAEEKKALLAQVRQLVEQNRIQQDENGISYQFIDDKKVKTVYVSNPIREAIIAGKAGIVRLDNNYEIVPAEIVQKIQLRHADSVVVQNQNIQETPATDDPYAAFQVPDDIIW